VKAITIDSEVWFITSLDELRPVKGLSLADVVRGLAKRYEFVVAPTTIPQNDQGLAFQEGTFRTEGHSVAIRRLELYPDGTHIVVASDSDDADLVMRDLRDWSISIGGRPDITPILQYHVSTIVCEFVNSIDNLVADFTAISEMVSSSLDVPASVNVRALAFCADPLQSPRATKLNPTLFRIEPRDQIEFARKRYFSFANMTTRKHLELLQWLDDLAAKTK
jgi:hypothetical protein